MLLFFPKKAFHFWEARERDTAIQKEKMIVDVPRQTVNQQKKGCRNDEERLEAEGARFRGVVTKICRTAFSHC